MLSRQELVGRHGGKPYLWKELKLLLPAAGRSFYKASCLRCLGTNLPGWPAAEVKTINNSGKRGRSELLESGLSWDA